jgi:hypothetical protein
MSLIQHDSPAWSTWFIPRWQWLRSAPTAFSMLCRASIPPHPSIQHTTQSDAHSLAPAPVSHIFVAYVSISAVFCCIATVTPSLFSQSTKVVYAFLGCCIRAVAERKDIAEGTTVTVRGFDLQVRGRCGFIRVVRGRGVMGCYGTEVDTAG